MDMTGERLIPASQEQTWDALNDPEVLKSCLPNCDELERLADNEYRVLMVVRIGPISAKFGGKLTLSDVSPPESYSIAFEGQGGAAGFCSGSAAVRLIPEPDQTRLCYEVTAKVGGKLAQIGSRLVDAAARKLAEGFFLKFTEKVASANPVP